MAEYQLTATDIIIRTRDGANIPNDPANRDCAEYNSWLAAGGVPDPYVTPAPAVPQSVSPRQARLALLAAGLLDQVEAAVNAAGGATKVSWDYATQINRTDPLIMTIGASLSLTQDQIDTLFKFAATQ